MKRFKAAVLAFAGAVFLLSASPASAGGGLVILDANPDTRLHPGEFFTVSATVYTNNTYTTRCEQCPVTFKFHNSNSTDTITPNATTTNSNGQASVRMVSNILGDRLVYAEVGMPDGSLYTSSSLVLAYNQTSTDLTAPTMVYPLDRQTLDLEGAYLFRVNQIPGATGYLFGLFQDGSLVYENYRDEKTLSANGEFALWTSNPAHKDFHQGEVKVMIRALVNSQWTDAREIYIYLQPRDGTATTTVVRPTVNPTATFISPPPVIPSTQAVTITHDSTVSAELQKRVQELEQKLAESQQKQTELESRLDQIINWIKSLFPFFR